MPKPVDQLAKILPTAWDAGISVHYSKVVDAVNTLLGYNGPAVIGNSLDVQGNPVQNVANPTEPTDALNLQTADANYAPSVQSQALDVNGSSPIKGLAYLYYQKKVLKLLSGANVVLSPTNGVGNVTVSIVPTFGAGAPSGAGVEGQIYFNTSTSPYNGYVYHSGNWQAFS